MKSKRFLVVGAGFSGAVLAHELATRAEAQIVVVDCRPHVAGNCHTERDAATGVLLHVYGPHIFNTDNERVWEYVNRFGTFRPYISRVKASTARGIFSLPVNLHTINQFFGRKFTPDEAREHVAGLSDKSIGEPMNFEEQALKFVGRDLYETFFQDYTRKQWGCEPRELPASILKRLPLRFNYDDNYYNKRHQGIPEEGYTGVIGRLLEHPSIEVRLNAAWHRHDDRSGYDHVFFTGPIDAYFEFSEGRLGYRTVTFERIDAEGDYQGCAIINYPDAAAPWTRIHEHKHFAPFENHEKTVAFREFSHETGPDDSPYYPKRLAADKALLLRYRALAEKETSTSFLGRLATYRYMDMETVIGEALEFSDKVVDNHLHKTAFPTFPNRET
jgi:UDP-galactopyranose mutase